MVCCWKMREGEDMKKAILAAGISCLAGPAIAATVLNAPADVASIHAFEQKNAEDLDAAGLAKSYAPDAIMLDYMTGGIYRGRPAIQKAVARQLAPIQSLSANIREQNIVTDGKFACAMMTTEFRVANKDGTTAAISLRQFDALRSANGQWQVVQEQVGAPKDAKTGMAMMHDLQVRGDTQWPADMTADDAVPRAQAKKEIGKWTYASLRVVGIDAIMPYYGPDDGEITMYAPTAPGNIRGKAEMRAYYAPSMNSFTSVDTKTPILKIDSDGALGAQIDVQDITLHLKDGKTQPLYWRQSDCVHRVGGKWYGVLDMSSFPMDLKTGKSESKWATFPEGTGTGAEP
jgi:ketosteroid isomerase-like protein